MPFFLSDIICSYWSISYAVLVPGELGEDPSSTASPNSSFYGEWKEDYCLLEQGAKIYQKEGYNLPRNKTDYSCLLKMYLIWL